MDPIDASRVLKDILKIGQNENAGNQAGNQGDETGASTSQENTGELQRDQIDNESTQENNQDSVFDSMSMDEQFSPRISLDPVHQLVCFTAYEQKGSVIVYGNEVHITTNEIGMREAAGSNRVRINPVVNFDWEPKYYNGNLLSVSAKYMCYALRGKSGFVVRILNRQTLLKALIKDFTGSIQDLCFAHYNSDVLACTDSAGDIFVWNIFEEDDKICHNLKLHLKRTSAVPTFLEGTRLAWCPYIEDAEEEDSDAGQVLAVTVGNVAEVLHISMITQNHGSSVDIEDVKEGIVRIGNGHTKPIRDISLAPDGSVLATASEDGHVKFWQLDFHSEPAGCLHEWQPHDGKPVSRLIFCDNMLIQDDKNPFWRFLITGAEHNSELKVWCTVTWSCLQTIKFNLPATMLSLCPTPKLQFKASLDLSARYLVLSDVNRKILYVFLLHEDLEEGKAHVTSVAQFLLTQPLLSFVITEAKMFKASVRDSLEQNCGGGDESKEGTSQDDQEPEEPREDEGKLIPTIKIKLHCIHPKAMQELTVQYHPFASVCPESPSTIADLSMTSADTVVQDALSDVSGLDSSSTEELETKSEPAVETTPTKLITPDTFTMPHTTSAAPTVSNISSISSITSVTSLNNTSFGDSISVDDLLYTTNATAMSEATYHSCEEVTLQEEPARPLPQAFLLDPLGLPLPESPDPAKVPFPAFNQKRDATKKANTFMASLSHSTPISRRSPDTGGFHDMEDTDKTPTGEDSAPPSEGGSLRSKEQLVEVVQQSETFSAPGAPGLEWNDHVDPTTTTLLKPGDLASSHRHDDDAGGAAHAQTEEDAEVKVLLEAAKPEPPSQSVEASATLSVQTQPSAPQSSVVDQEPYVQRQQRKPNLAITPRKQVSISPETVRKRKATGGNDASPQLDEVLALLRTQQIEMQQIKAELQNQQQHQNRQVSEVLREEVAMLEGAISSRVETALAEHAKEQDQRFDSFAREKQASDKQKHEKVASVVSAAVSSKVEKTVKNEVRNSVSSGLQKLTASMQDQVNTTMSQKLTATDAVLKEAIQKMVKDKGVTEAVGSAVSNVIQKRLQVILTDVASSFLVPGFEKACQGLFVQLNNAFLKGTQQYIASLESFIEGQKEQQREQQDPVVQQLEALVQSFQQSSENMSTNMTASLMEMMQTQLTSSMKRLQSMFMGQLREDLNKSLQETIHKEVRDAVLEQSMTEPVSHSSTQRKAQLHVQELINAGNFSQAFQEALTASDLNLVVMVCHACDPTRLFGQQPCPLNQPILLSLIQQLSIDLSTDTEVKQKYLTEAVLALDTEDAITREHVASILHGLCHQVKATIQTLGRTDPTNGLIRSLKMLLMAAQSLVK